MSGRKCGGESLHGRVADAPPMVSEAEPIDLPRHRPKARTGPDGGGSWRPLIAQAFSRRMTSGFASFLSIAALTRGRFEPSVI